MKITFILFLVICTLFFTCSKSSKPKDLNSGDTIFHFNLEKSFDNLKSVPLSMLGSKLEYIALESRPDCMLDGIKKLVLFDSFIFVSDSRKLLQFKRDGKFIKQIGRIGRGPGDYLSISDFDIDIKNNKIYILNRRAVQIYDYYGNYEKTFTIDFSACQMIIENSNSFIFRDLNFYIKVINPMFKPNFPDTIYSIHITDSTGMNLTKIRHDLRQGNVPYINTILSPLYSHNGSITFLETGIDTAYHLNNRIKEPYAVFNLGKRKMDPHFVDNEKYAGVIKNKFWIVSLNENNNYFFLDLMQGLSDSMNYCLINKVTRKANVLLGKGFKNDLDGGIDFWPNQVYKDTVLVSFIDAFKFLNHTKTTTHERIKVLRQGLTQTSNPVIIILN